MAKYRRSEVKKCPRCGEKCLFNAPKCPECGLLFSRLSLVTNKAGKRCVRKHQKDKVLYVSSWPEDAKRWKALLLCGFLGLYGAHNFYLGRYIKATFSLIFSTITTIFAAMTVYPDFITLLFSFLPFLRRFRCFFGCLTLSQSRLANTKFRCQFQTIQRR